MSELKLKPTAEQLRWAGKVWATGLRRHNEALVWLCSGSHSLADSLWSVDWQNIGHQLQCEICVNLLFFEDLMKRSRRG